ncbi:MAG: tyrosine-type recombinase/integrase [Bradyrhizobium sp.]|uniref:tyrosine-type recombinase/integrase n=1 Tax=Bradyrhizobium sp. TaxID=376 RepID=UPI003D0C9158
MTRGGGQDRGIFERRAGSGIWWVRYHDEHGAEHRERVGPKQLAKTIYTRRRAAVIEKRFNVDIIRRQAVTLDKAVDDYLARRAGAASIRNLRRIGRMWKKRLGARALHDIRPRDVELFRAARLAEVSEQTVYHDLSFLRAIFTQAVKDGRAVQQPVKDLRQPRAHRVRYLTAKEEARLYDHLAPRWHPLLTIALHTGMRQAEQFGLTWGQVDLAARVVKLPKSKSGQPRTIELNDTALDVFRAMPTRLRTDWVFVGRTGRRVNARNFYRRAFLPALLAAKIEEFVWHDLRHTFASRLVASGADLRTVADLLGHTSLQMVMRYAHLQPGARSAAVRLLDVKQNATGTTTGTGASRAIREVP